MKTLTKKELDSVKVGETACLRCAKIIKSRNYKRHAKTKTHKKNADDYLRNKLNNQP